MTSESIVEINGHLYRYAYKDGQTVYEGPVGDAPTIREDEFLQVVQTKRLHTYEEVMKNRRLLKGTKAPWRRKWQKVEISDTTARFRINDPVDFVRDTFFALDGKQLSRLGFRKGASFKEQPKDLRREIYQYGLEPKEREWVMKDLSRQPDPKQSYYVIADFKGRVPKERSVQSVVRRLQ
jgi:hypothetical protein